MMIPITAWDRELKRYVPVPSMPWVIRNNKALVPWSGILQLSVKEASIILAFIQRHPEAFDYDRTLDCYVLLPKRTRRLRRARHLALWLGLAALNGTVAIYNFMMAYGSNLAMTKSLSGTAVVISSGAAAIALVRAVSGTKRY